MANAEKLSFAIVQEAAKSADWEFVDQHIGDFLDREHVNWAFGAGLLDGDDNIRDLAATILNESDMPLSDVAQDSIRIQMETDTHPIVRFRLAVALHKRGDTHASTERVFGEALADPDVGPTAARFK